MLNQRSRVHACHSRRVWKWVKSVSTMRSQDRTHPQGMESRGWGTESTEGLWAGDHAWLLDRVVLVTRATLPDGDSLRRALVVFLCVNIVRDLEVFTNCSEVNDGNLHFISRIFSDVLALSWPRQSSDCYNIPRYPGLIEQGDIFIPITNQQADKQAYY